MTRDPTAPTTLERRGSIPLDRRDAMRPRWLTRNEALSNPVHPPRSETRGFTRVVFEGLRGSTCEQAMLCIPAGQAVPAYRIGAEHLITVLTGAVQFSVLDEQTTVGELGQIFIPANVKYEIRNVGGDDAWFLNVRGSAGVWPYAPAEYDT